MDTETLHTRREARRRAARRRRRAAGLLALTGVALAAVVVATRSGGTSKATRDAQGPGFQRGAAPVPAGTANPRAARGQPGTVPVPILMYHVIAAPPAGAPFPGLYVSPGELAAQVQALKSAGWHAVTLDQVRAHWKQGAPLGPGKPIVLSFDNGYHSQYTQALPILRRLGWVGDENIQLTGLPPSQGGLDANQIRALVAGGWELDTQGFSHADLIALNAAQLHYEVAVSRKVLQQRFGVPVNWFCYPSGHYDSTVVAAVQAAGYSGSTSVVPGWAHPADDPYRLHRLRVLGGTTPGGLLALIGGVREDPAAPASYNGA
jgi:peptidoglycan/xylan/chitin deacetylase (PgdA/CDA1 family)